VFPEVTWSEPALVMVTVRLSKAEPLYAKRRISLPVPPRVTLPVPSAFMLVTVRTPPAVIVVPPL
jgi:hypothetical protein